MFSNAWFGHVSPRHIIVYHLANLAEHSLDLFRGGKIIYIENENRMLQKYLIIWTVVLTVWMAPGKLRAAFHIIQRALKIASGGRVRAIRQMSTYGIEFPDAIV